jgi:uncharacterized protein
MLTEHLRILYLHGFASSPASRKATFFAQRLRARGFSVDIPDLAEGNFEGLTISGQLRLVERVSCGEPVILIGSSLGGYLASLYAARHTEVPRLVLLAPAFQLYKLWTANLTHEDLAGWKAAGAVPVFHYGEGRKMPIGYQFINDANRFEPFPDVTQPVLIFHGEQDSSVPIEYSLEFTRRHPNARLIRLPSGHELTDVLEPMWEQIEKFLLPGAKEA